MRWHVALRVFGAAMLIAAATVLSLQVHVGGSGASGRACGSAFDVLADRVGWEEWYAQDAADSATGSAPSLVRTLDCPNSVNHRSLVAGLLGIGGVVAFGFGSLQKRQGDLTPGTDTARRLRLLGHTVTVVGTVLVLAGIATLIVLLANRDSALFVYVERPLVAVVGLIVLIPVIALIAGGRALVIVARTLEHRHDDDETR